MFGFIESWIKRILRRFGLIFVHTFNLPPIAFGYLVLRQDTLSNYKKSTKTIKSTVFFPLSDFNFKPPINVFDGNTLPIKKVFGRSFFEVQKRSVEPVELIEVDNASIVSYYDQWNNEFSMAIDENFAVVPIRSTGFHPAHAKILRTFRPISLDIAVAWIFEAWSGNYFHWLVYHIPKAIFFKKKYPSLKLLLPELNSLDSIIVSSLKMIGYSDEQLIRQPGKYVSIGKLFYLSCDQFDPRLIGKIPEKYSVFGDIVPKRLVYISRKKAKWRNVINEQEVVEFLFSLGFEIISMESLSFEEQVRLMSEAIVLVGPHGAGLANMVFSPKGLTIVEFVLPSFPNSDYYSLANCLGHSYGLFLADHVSDEKEPALQDMRISIPRLKDLLEEFVFSKIS